MSWNVQALISSAEYILRVEALLEIAFPLQRRFRHDARQVGAAQFPYSMMMRQRATRLQDLVARDVFELQIDFVRIRNSFVIETEIEIDADPCSIQLRDACRYERLTRQCSLLIFIEKPPFDVFAQV